MSRIGKYPVKIPAGVEVKLENSVLTIKGPKGALTWDVHPTVSVQVKEAEVAVEKKNNSKIARAMWGTAARLIANMITGVTEGFSKKLELEGVGFRMALKGKELELALGFSHPVKVAVPNDLTVTVDGMSVTVAGIDKRKVGQFAADLRALKPVEPYKGKGFRYEGEHVRRKEGKKAAA